MTIKRIHANQQPHHELEHLAGLVKDMLHASLDAFARMAVENVPAIAERDLSVGREHIIILRQLITRMMESPRNITWALDVLSTVRSLERIGNHACYICDHLNFMVKGKGARHLSQPEFE